MLEWVKVGGSLWQLPQRWRKQCGILPENERSACFPKLLNVLLGEYKFPKCKLKHWENKWCLWRMLKISTKKQRTNKNKKTKYKSKAHLYSGKSYIFYCSQFTTKIGSTRYELKLNHLHGWDNKKLNIIFLKSIGPLTSHFHSIFDVLNVSVV